MKICMVGQGAFGQKHLDALKNIPTVSVDADGNATKAAQGFARKCGVAAEDLVRREDTDGREYVFAEKNIPSAPATPITRPWWLTGSARVTTICCMVTLA